MPNRILRDWTDSEAIDQLTVQAERFFTRLIMKVDDYGRYTANVKMLKSMLFPLRTDVRETDITRWLTECAQSGLIVLYIVASKEYVQIENFKQQLRQKIEKYPSPDVCDADATHPLSNCSPETKQNPKQKPKPETEAPPPEIILPFESLEFKELWIQWKNYRKNEFKKVYKTETTEQAALQNLCKLSGGEEQMARDIIMQSIANQWQGLFELKKQNEYGKTNSANTARAGSKVNGEQLNEAFAKFYQQK